MRTWRWRSWMRTRMNLVRRMRLPLRCTGESFTWIDEINLSCQLNLWIWITFSSCFKKKKSQAEETCWVESKGVKERVWGGYGDFWSGLCARSEQGWRRHLGGAASLQTRVSLVVLLVSSLYTLRQKWQNNIKYTTNMWENSFTRLKICFVLRTKLLEPDL